jgi:hypothetical protein
MTSTPTITRKLAAGSAVFYLTADGYWRHEFVNNRGRKVFAKVSTKQQARIDAALAEGAGQ